MNDSEFALREGLIFLNHAGVSPWPVRTATAVVQFARENMLEGSVNHLKWLEVEAGLRGQAQTLLNAPSKDCISLLKNTSEALSIVAYGLNWKDGDNVVSTDQEFPSNRIVWESLCTKGVELRQADLRSAASPEDALFSLTDGNTRLLTVSSVQFSSGLRMDLTRLGEFCRKRGILFCVDAIQSIGAVRFDVQEIQADFVMADGHKWMIGPEGIALFYCHPDAMDRLRLVQYGWHMVEDAGNFDRKDWSVAKTARRFECGSPNMLGIHALHASLSLLLERGMERIEKDVLLRSEYLIELIRSKPELELATPSEPGRFAGIVTFRKRGVDSSSLYQFLGSRDVVAALRGGSIRYSSHFYTPPEHLERAVELVTEYQPS